LPLRLTPILAALAVLVLGACGRAPTPGREALVIAIRPDESVAAQSAAWAPFLADMSKALGLSVEPFFGSTDTARLDALRFQQADLAWFDNATGLQAVRRAGSEVFARAAMADGSDAYRVALLARKDSGVTLERVLACDRTLSLGLGETRSAIETEALKTYLLDPRGQTPEACFKTVREAKAEANIYAVSAGVLDTAAAATTAMTEVAAADRGALAKVETLWASPLIPDGPLVWRKNLDPALKARISNFLFGYGKGDGRRADAERAVLARIGLRGFARTDDSHFLVPREMDAAERLRRARDRHDAMGEARARADLEAIAAEQAKNVPSPPPPS
jgi:phosphonate transport system substrate-binding protein